MSITMQLYATNENAMVTCHKEGQRQVHADIGCMVLDICIYISLSYNYICILIFTFVYSLYYFFVYKCDSCILISAHTNHMYRLYLYTIIYLL